MALDDIVVFGRFDTLIEANIAKTKLDAYGIPCFLTEEIGSLTTPLLLGGIRLHIFARDAELAQQYMSPAPLAPAEEDGLISCPRCQSRKIIRQSGSSPHARFTRWIVNVMLGLSKPLYCQHCGHEFHA